MIAIFIKLNLPITWITPAELKISYTNFLFSSTKVKSNLLSSSKVTIIKLSTDNLDSLPIKRSFYLLLRCC